MPYLLDVKPESGLYIYSASEAFGEEQVFSFIRLWNWLKHFNFRVRGFKLENGLPVFEKCLHASGHISEEELAKVIEEIDPDYIIPVHTENPSWFKKRFDNVVLLKEGESKEF